MSRRRPPRREQASGGRSRPPAGQNRPRDPHPGEKGRGPRPGRIARDVAVLAAAFGAAVGIAELAGAANLGVAFGVGQVVFVIVLVVLLTRG